MVQQNVAAAHRLQDVGRARALLVLGEVAVGLRQEGRVGEILAVEPHEGPQTAQVQRPGEHEDLVLGHPEFPHEQVEHMRCDGVLHLQAHRRAETAPAQLPLQGLEKVLRVVLLDLEVLVAGDAEQVVLEDVHSWEQHVEMLGDQVLERNET